MQLSRLQRPSKARCANGDAAASASWWARGDQQDEAGVASGAGARQDVLPRLDMSIEVLMAASPAASAATTTASPLRLTPLSLLACSSRC